jgi:hypothetical protein
MTGACGAVAFEAEPAGGGAAVDISAYITVTTTSVCEVGQVS